MAKLLSSLQINSRKKKFQCFMEFMKPTSSDKVLVVGYDVLGLNPIANMIEGMYPYQENLTKLTADNPNTWAEEFKNSGMIYGDGRNLAYEADSFDICMSNAALEHVGDTEDQKKFISEMCRVAPKVFLTTPNYYFPYEIHARMPFVHWLPEGLRNWILRKTGNAWTIGLNLVSSKNLKRLFPKDMDVKIYGSRTTFMSESLVAVAYRKHRDK